MNTYTPIPLPLRRTVVTILIVETDLEEGESLAGHGSHSLGSWTDYAAVFTITARAVRRRPSSGQAERHPP